MSGTATALSEITLVLFTTLAPAGAMAYVLMAIPFIAEKDGEDTAHVRCRLDRFLGVPVLIAMLGLVASTTHLGNPANALYVLAGVGRSPLSNEVVSGVVFLGSAGVFWLTSFSETYGHRLLRRIFAGLISALGLLFIGTISLAYNASTIITWNTPLAPASIWLNALAGGPMLALLILRSAGFSTPEHRLGAVYIAISSAALVANVVVYLVWGMELPTMHNALTSADTLAPLFIPAVLLFAALGVASELLCVKAVRWKGETPVWIPICSAILMFAGIFVMRFSFYMIHMTVGL